MQPSRKNPSLATAPSCINFDAAHSNAVPSHCPRCPLSSPYLHQNRSIAEPPQFQLLNPNVNLGNIYCHPAAIPTTLNAPVLYHTHVECLNLLGRDILSVLSAQIPPLFYTFHNHPSHCPSLLLRSTPPSCEIPYAPLLLLFLYPVCVWESQEREPNFPWIFLIQIKDPHLKWT